MAETTITETTETEQGDAAPALPETYTELREYKREQTVSEEADSQRGGRPMKRVRVTITLEDTIGDDESLAAVRSDVLATVDRAFGLDATDVTVEEA